MARTEMEIIQEPDWEYFRDHSLSSFAGSGSGSGAAARAGLGLGVYGVWSDDGVDKWVGKEGPLVRGLMGGEEGGRVRLVGKIPHAFCLCE